MIVDLTAWASGHRRPKEPGEKVAAGAAGRPVLGTSVSGTPVYWELPTLAAAAHVLCLAGSGAGKTMLLAQALAGEIAESERRALPQRLALLLIDPKGDLIQALAQNLALTARSALASVQYLDPFSPGAFPFNLNHLSLGETPLDIRAMQLAQLVADVSTATTAQRHLGVGARQLDVLQHVLLGALAVPHKGASVLLALDALNLRGGLKLLGAVTTSPRAKAFLLATELGDELRVSSAARLRSAFAATEHLERLLAAPCCLNFDELLAPGAITVLDVGRPVGGMTTLSAFYANLFARLAIEHLMTRPSPWRGHPCRIVVDEAQLVAPVLADRAEAILTTGRSRGLSLVTVSQGTRLLEQAAENLLPVLLSNTALKIIGRLAASDALLLAKEQAPAKGSEEALSTVRARFVASVMNLRDREFYHLTPASRLRFMSRPLDTARRSLSTSLRQG